MSEHQLFVWASAIIALVLYCPLIYGVLKGDIRQSVATWILWVLLDAIALVSIIFQKGNYLLLVFYCIGGSTVALALVYKRLFSWTKFETFVLLLVIICLVVWSQSGSKWATITSTVAVCISGAPQIRDSWREPHRATGLIYLGYTLANTFSFLGGKDWTVEERFYPGLVTILCLIMAAVSLRPKKVAEQACLA